MFSRNALRAAVRALAGIGAVSFSLGLPFPVAEAQTSLASFANLTSPAASSLAKTRKSSQTNRSTVTLNGYSAGTIVIRTRERRLYYVIGDGKAVRYPVGVGRPDKQWSGHSAISGKYIKPAWSAPEEIRRDNPRLPKVIPSGAPNNPMGAAALTLSGGEYAIHGTNRPGSVGGFVSYGCIRMLNSDILDLFDRVAVGTPVVVER
jgi:lipoprotein-anchoring transpeptidase ErfK/SrfK